jgi:hypothetical protein
MTLLRPLLLALVAGLAMAGPAMAVESAPPAKSPAAAPAHDVTGNWVAVFQISTGPSETRFTFKVEGNKLTGSSKSRATSDSTVHFGRISGDTMTWSETVTATSNSMLIDLQYTGKIVSADEIRLSREVGTYGTQEAVAKRVKETADAPGAEPAVK